MNDAFNRDPGAIWVDHRPEHDRPEAIFARNRGRWTNEPVKKAENKPKRVMVMSASAIYRRAKAEAERKAKV